MTGAVGPITPTLERFESESRTAETVIVARQLFADLDTPVSAYLKIRDASPSFLLESVEGGERIGRYSFIGAAPRHVLRLKDGIQYVDGLSAGACADPLLPLRERAGTFGPPVPSLGRFQGGLLGYLSYEAARYFERLPRAARDPLRLPDAAWMEVDTLLVFDHVAHTIHVLSHAHLDDSLTTGYRQAIERIDRLVDRLQQPLEAERWPQASVGSVQSNMTRSRYEEMVRSTKSHIVAGDILQAVISQRLSTQLDGDPFAIYRRLRRTSPSPFMYFLDFQDHQVIGASPELLVQADGRRVSTMPIAGTRPRGRSEVEDAQLGKELLDDEKERAEHLMLVDLARNDLGRVCAPGSVKVPQFMSVERFSHVMHLVSDVEGSLAPGFDAFDALRSTFPAGTVSGAPKIRAMQIIAELEEDTRGPYAGALGFIGPGGSMEMAITIRTAVVTDRTLHLQVGAGIVADSQPEREFDETMNKARGVLRALENET